MLRLGNSAMQACSKWERVIGKTDLRDIFGLKLKNQIQGFGHIIQSTGRHVGCDGHHKLRR